MTATISMGCAWVAASMLSMSTLAAEPLVCPDGTKHKAETDAKQYLAEWCVDVEIGRRRGPQREYDANGRLRAEGMNDPANGRREARIYDENGVLLDEITIERGKITKQKSTRAGLEKFVAQLNDGPRNEEYPTSYHLVDEHTVGIDFHFADADPDSEKGRAKLEGFRIYTRAGFCKQLKFPDQIEALQFRVLKAAGSEPVMTAMLKREECVAP